MKLFRPIGDRFIDPERGEMLVIERDGCDLCAYSAEFNTHDSCNPPERLPITGTCLLGSRLDYSSVQFVNLNDYAVFKLTGEWPWRTPARSARSSNTQGTTRS